MEFTDVSYVRFYVAGIEVRTSNKDGRSQKDLAELWARFFGENIMDKIPDKKGDYIYCIYTDYESDHTGEYTAMLGCRVTSLDDLPAELVGRDIPVGYYRHTRVEGPVPGVVAEAWNEIWASGMERSYKNDLEVYHADSFDPANAVVDIYLS